MLEILKRQNRPMRMDALLKAMGLPRRMRAELEENLNALAASGKVARLPGGGWVLPEALKSVAGVFRLLPTGGGMVRKDGEIDKSAEIYIPPLHTLGAWTGDRVKVLLTPAGAEGKVAEILQRPDKNVAAIVLKKQAGALFCHPANGDLPVNFQVPLKKYAEKIEPGCLVEIHPEKELGRDLWQAALVRVFGDAATEGAQECIVKLKHDVPMRFPELALDQAESMPDAPYGQDMEGREDMRHVPFVTIDGADSRDFDDAIYVERACDGWLLRVAIADVSHYVPSDSQKGSLDAEAMRRGNSWYFPRSVEPMLPQALSNGLCSLRPNVDRLAVLAEITFSDDGEPGEPRFAMIVIKSAARLTYDLVWQFFEARADGKKDADKIIADAAPKEVAPMLAEAFNLYKKLAQKRSGRGSLDFEIPECSYKFDAAGELCGIGVASRNDAHMLIEEFMIAANEAVARHLEKSYIPFLYRDHPAPEQIKLAALYESLKSANLEKLPANIVAHGQPNPRALKEVLAIAKGTPQEYAVNRMCLRAMQQARYLPENLGHFGLASSAYCHFTSPIRRYADLLTHRALKRSLGVRAEVVPDKEKLLEIGDHLNKREREAMECEREMARRLGCLYLRNHVGEALKGTISAVTSFGAFVEFDSMPVEGLIRLADLGNDWFELDERQQKLIGMRSGISWHLGQPLEVRIESVDLEKMEIKLAPVKMPLPARKGPHGRRMAKKSEKRAKTPVAPGREKASPTKHGGKRGRAAQKTAHKMSNKGSAKRRKD